MRRPWKTLSNRAPFWVFFLAGVAGLGAGCASTNKTARRPAGGPPVQLQAATKQQLIGWYNEQAKAIRSVNATISMKLTAGTAYSGVIKQYHEVKGFLLAQRPSSIRVIGQAPIVGTNIFDMASDGQTFGVYIPSKNKFLEGSANLQRESAHPIENLRPQHLTDAMFWTLIPEGAPVLFEAGDEAEERYYILTVVSTKAGDSAETGNGDSGNGIPQRLKPIDFELRATRLKPCPDDEVSCVTSDEVQWNIVRKVWFDRADLSVARIQVYDAGGNVTSDVRYSQWGSFGDVKFARQIEVTRPAEDYALQMGITKLTANEELAADKFELKQPPGTELVRVDEQTKAPGTKEQP